MRIKPLIRRRYQEAGPYEGVMKIRNSLAEDAYIVVREGKEFFGILTAADLVRTPHNLIVDCLHQRPIVGSDAAIGEVLTLMHNRGFSVLPVIEGESFEGVILKDDILEFLQEDQERTRRASDAKTDFLARMSHELRTPLNAIIGFSQMLKNGETGALSEVQLEFMNYIEESGLQLSKMVDEILDLSVIEAGKMQLDRTAFDLSRAVQHWTSLMTPLAVKKEISFSVTVPPSPLFIEGDESKLHQVFKNLVHNAIKFSGLNTWITIEVSAVKNSARVSVSDQGCGIPRASLKKIFEPFLQVQTEGTHREGAGLGLAISKKIIELHGGRLTVASTTGRGSSFTMTVPGRITRTVAVAQTARAALPTGSPQGNARVLVVEDNRINQKLIQHALLPVTGCVDAAVSGEEGVRLFTERRYDIVLMDVELPGMNGIEAMRRLRRLRQGVPVIALTAYAMKGDRERFLADGFDDYLAKPINITALKQLVALHAGRLEKNDADDA